MKKITFYKSTIKGFIKDAGYLITSKDYENIGNTALVIHKNNDGWIISELTTGIKALSSKCARRIDFIKELDVDVYRKENGKQKRYTQIELIRELIQNQMCTEKRAELREYALNNDKDFYNLLVSFDDNTPTTAKNDDTTKENTKNDITTDTPNNTPKKAKKRYHKNDYINNLHFQPCYSQFINATIKALENNAPLQDIKDTFYSLYDDVKNLHKYPNGTVYVSETKETADEIFTIIETIHQLKDISLEVVGRFLWTNGKQKQHHKILKSLGFSYQENKAKYCKSYQGYVRKDGRKFSYAKIKQMYAVDEQ